MQLVLFICSFVALPWAIACLGRKPKRREDVFGLLLAGSVSALLQAITGVLIIKEAINLL